MNYKKLGIYYSMISAVIITFANLYQLFNYDLNFYIKITILPLLFIIYLYNSRFVLLLYNHFFIEKEEHYRLSKKEMKAKDKLTPVTLNDYIVGLPIFLTILISNLSIMFYTYNNIFSHQLINIFLPGALFMAIWAFIDMGILASKTIF